MGRKKKKTDNNLQMSLFSEADFEQPSAEQQKVESPESSIRTLEPKEDSAMGNENSHAAEETTTPASTPQLSTESQITEEEDITEVDRSILVKKMQETLRILEYTSPNTIRLISLESSIIFQKGIQFNQKFTLKALPDKQLNWYEFVALYYCSFANAFPTMLDKINQEYMDCYQEASQIFEL